MQRRSSTRSSTTVRPYLLAADLLRRALIGDDPRRPRGSSRARRAEAATTDGGRSRLRHLSFTAETDRPPEHRQDDHAERLRLHPRRQQQRPARPHCRAASQVRRRRCDPARRHDRQPLGRRRARRLRQAAVRGRERSPRRRARAAPTPPSRRLHRRKPALRRTDRRLDLPRRADDPATGNRRENPFDTLLALYLVAKSPERGVWSRSPAGSTPTRHGTAHRHLRRPAPAPLLALQRPLPRRPAQPAGHAVRLRRLHHRASTSAPGAIRNRRLRPSPADPIGIGGAAGPARPGLRAVRAERRQAGPLNSQRRLLHARSTCSLTRTDAEQEITSYSADLPPGLLGKLAGIPYCPEAAIAAAEARAGRRRGRTPLLPGGQPDRPHRRRLRGRLGPRLRARQPLPRRPLPRRAALGGRDRLGHVGPFDLGTVVVRSAIRIDPRDRRRSRSTPPARTRSPTSSTASRCTCATSASTSTARTSPSTRPAAKTSRRMR